MVSYKDIHNLGDAVQLDVIDIDALDDLIDKDLSSLDDSSNYKNSSSYINDPTSHSRLSNDLEVSTAISINEGTIFPSGSNLDFDITISDPESISTGTEVDLGKAVKVLPTNLPEAEEEIILPANFTATSTIKMEHNGSSFELTKGTSYSDYKINAGTKFTQSFINCIPGLKLNTDIDSPQYLEKGDTIEGPFNANFLINGEVNGAPTTIDSRNSLAAGDIFTVTDELVLLDSAAPVIKGKLPKEVRTSGFNINIPGRTVSIPAGTLLAGKKLDEVSEVASQSSITTLNAMTTEEIDNYNTPSHKLAKWKNTTPQDNAISLFENLFLSNQSTSIYSPSKFNEINDFIKEINEGPSDSSVLIIKSKYILKLLKQLRKLNRNLDPAQKFNQANLDHLITRLESRVDILEDPIETDQAATHRDDFGSYVEKSQGFLKNLFGRERSENEIRNEIKATTNQVRAKISDKLSQTMEAKDDIDENKEVFEKFKTQYAKEAMSEGMDVILSRLDQVYTQAIDERQNYLDNTISGKFQKVGAAFKKLSFGKKILGFGALYGSGILLAGATGSTVVIPAAMWLAHRGYATYSFGGVAKDLNKKLRTKLNSNPKNLHKANSVEMDYFLRSMPDTEEAEQKQELDSALNKNRSLQRQAMNSEVKKALATPKYKNRIKTLKENLENASTIEESKSALASLQLSYTEMITEIMEDFYDKQIKAMISARRFRTPARLIEYGTGAGFTYGLTFLPKAVVGVADWIKGINPEDTLESVKSAASDIDFASRWEAIKATASDPFSMIGFGEANAATPPTTEVTQSLGKGMEEVSKAREAAASAAKSAAKSVTNPDTPIDKPLDSNGSLMGKFLSFLGGDANPTPDSTPTPEATGNPDTPTNSGSESSSGSTPKETKGINEAIDAARNNLHGAIPKNGIEFKIPNDEIASKLLGDKDPGLHQIFNFAGEKKVSFGKVKPLILEFAKENGISNINKINDGDISKISPELLGKFAKLYDCKVETLIQNLNKLSK